MILTINNYLNARSGAATVNSPVYKIKEPGSTIDADKALIGDLFNDSRIWLHNAKDDCYYWSGGIATNEFAIPGNDINLLKEDQPMQVLSEAKTYYWQKYADKGLNGISIERDDNGYKMSFRFKSIDDLSKIPGVEITFRGFTIPSVVIQGTKGKFSMPRSNFVSDSLSAVQQNEAGTAGIKVNGTRPNDKRTYLLANYHVAAFSLLKKKQYTFPYPNSEEIDCVMPSWSKVQSLNNKIGTLSKGLFNDWHDIALVLLDNPDSVSNTTLDGTPISQSLDIFNNADYKNKTVTLYGAVSGVNDATIFSVNAAQNFEYLKTDFKKDNLIQMTRISEEGDSGGPVLLDGKLVGLLMGFDDDYSYVLPIQRILNFFHLSL
jgi:hypothetical protein